MFQSTSLQRILACTIIAVWFVIPTTLIPTAFQNNNHYLQTLRDFENRPGQYLQLDRCSVVNQDNKWFVETISGEQIELVASSIPASGTYSMTGTFEHPQRLAVRTWHRHSVFRDIASLAGLGAIALWFSMLAMRQYRGGSTL
ncbi:MAG: hypothetical protein IH838_04595 [Proteobacteria bacterium]|nr:hypothetical protein [Pseudomonadota bacterium]